jgi:hypothetical protein
LRDRLVTFRDESGRELFDLPRAPRPPADTPAPVRFLPDYDNLVLGHADRSRFIDAEHRPRMITKNLRVPGPFLIDGRVAGTWEVRSTKKLAELTLSPFGKVPRREKTELEAEGLRLVHFIDPEASSHACRFESR